MASDITQYKCDCNVIHQEVVDEVRGRLTDKDELQDLAALFKVLGDPTRVTIITVLQGVELCVCDLAHVLNMTQSAVSHQLRVLKQARLVKNRREGKIVYYTLDDEHISAILDMGLDHLRHD